MVDPILDVHEVSVLLGPPDEKTKNEEWLYYFNAEKNWHLELSFMDGKLFHTSYRQLISADEFSTNNASENIDANAPNSQR